jgi:outer membrane protein assembly factor BamA
MGRLFSGMKSRSTVYYLSKVFFRFSSVVLMVWFLSASSIDAQVLSGTDDEEPEIQLSILPVLGYSSDTSLFGGLFFQRINYGSRADQPFLNSIRGDIGGSLRGDLTIQAKYDRTKTFNADIRSTLYLWLFRSRVAHYFGLGNDTDFSQDLYDENFFYYEIREANFLYRGRKTVREFGFVGKIDLFSNLKVSYADASMRDEVSRFSEEREQLQTSGWLNKLGVGIIIDDRDSEFDPTEGFRYEAGVQASHSILGSDSNSFDTWVELLHYLEILPNIVIAQKIRGEYIVGDMPFWGLSTIGNEKGLRGYHLDRFRGDSSILHILEARTWLFSIFDDQIRFGGQLYWDSGRVFSEQDSNRFFGNWKHSYGFGGAISLFSSDFIIRGDLGFSNEATRIYAGVGYIF